jgi:hypothetical protein
MPLVYLSEANEGRRKNVSIEAYLKFLLIKAIHTNKKMIIFKNRNEKTQINFFINNDIMYKSINNKIKPADKKILINNFNYFLIVKFFNFSSTISLKN